MAEKQTPEPEETIAPRIAPIQSRPRPTLKAWLELPGHRQRLTEILSDPVFLVAEAFVCESMQVNAGDLTGSNRVLLGEEIVRKTSLHTGAVYFSRKLRSLLTQAPSEDGITSEVPWDHVKPDPD